MAAPFLTVHVDTRELDAALTALQRPRLDIAVAKGLAATTKNAAVKATQLIAKRTSLKSAVVRPLIIPDYVRPGDYTTHIRSSRKPIPLIAFPSTRAVTAGRGRNARGAGVSTRAWGAPQTLRSAFIATMPRNSRADAGAATGGDGHTSVFRRTSRSRLPIEKLWGPTIAGTFATEEVAAVMATTIRTRLDFNLRRAIRAELRRRR